ncbi:MAG: gliding motility-associated C-terminal domain-containing protein [Muribaculaceae bacterium]|nr:gliding motility-associated C-terminal domain-containing protein [Muribaculaceae bacterium]
MKKILPILFLLIVRSAMAQLNFSGMADSPVVITPDKSTGLEYVYVIDNTDGNAVVSYKAASESATVTWEQWGAQGGAYASEMTGLTRQGNVWSVKAPAADTGFTITENGRPRSFWVTNYANHRLELHDLVPENGGTDCNSTTLILHGNASPIRYYSINGRAVELSRELALTYRTQQYDETMAAFTDTEKTEQIASVSGNSIHAPAPLCNTTFILTGDRFLTAWHRPQQVESPIISPTAVAAHTTAVQAERDNDNEQKEEAALGGSAPVDITFTAAVSDASIFRQWEFARDPEFDIPDVTYSDLELTYTFTDAGTTYVRFTAANADGSCEWVSDTYEVFVGESALLCPNAFSPGGSPGVNDIWKVSYKSIVSFACSIFNRWGVKIISFDDPSQGWDGKHNGKLVQSGVYYYVIKATGADGKQYDLAGDINIINSTYTGNGTSPTEPQ